MGNKREYMKKHAKVIGILILMLIFLMGILFVRLMSVETERVTSDEIKEYVQEYFSEYTYLYNGHNVVYSEPPTDVNNFTFGWRNFDTNAVISTTHGAALFFNPSGQGSSRTTVQEVSDPIEYYLWPQMLRDVSGLPVIGIKPGEYLFDGVITVHGVLMYAEPGANMRCVMKDRPFNVTSDGAVVIFGTYIVEHSTFLKGSNDKEDWSRTQADIDALSEYLYDCKCAGMNETATQNVETKYKPSMLLERIASRMKSGAYKNNQALFNSDYEELRRVASDTMNDMLTKVLNDYYALQQEGSPSFTEQVANYLFQKADAIVVGVIVGVIPTFVITWLGIDRRKSKSTKR